MKKFNVMVWEINSNQLIAYDVLPYFRNQYANCKKKDRPSTKEQWEAFVKRWGKYNFWARCEYEIIITSWPVQDKRVKVDVWQQIEPNIDLIVEILMTEYEK